MPREGVGSLEASMRLARLTDEDSLEEEEGQRLRWEVERLREEVSGLRTDLDTVRQTREEMAKLYRKAMANQKNISLSIFSRSYSKVACFFTV
jgi:hypothetical protein